MNKRSFKFVASFTLFMFLATPIGAFAQCGPGGCSGGGGGQSFGGDSFSGGASSGGGLFGGGGSGGGGGLESIIAPLALASAFGGLGRGGAGAGGLGGGGGGGGQIGQALTLAGALTGNMGLLMAGLIMSMLGGLGGGNTPQQGNVDERYVGQGQGYGNGGGSYGNGYGNQGYGNGYGNQGYGSGYAGGQGYNPYYPTPNPIPGTVVNAPNTAACNQSLFIVKDTTVTPNDIKPYPSSISITQNQCVLAINTDNTSSHQVTVRAQSTSSVNAGQSIGVASSHIFRFSRTGGYTMCVDGADSYTAIPGCTVVTVQ